MRKIVVVTDSRAEYGVLKHILKKISDSPRLDLYMIVTGAHLSETYGYTIKEIEKDGFTVSEKIPVCVEENENIRVAVEMGHLMNRLAHGFVRIRPDILLILGDRYEMLAAASVAVGMHIPIAHISGGEVTEGAMDEQIRHAITKMAHIHFPGASVYARNIRKMGEESWRIFDVGDPGIENIKNIRIREKEELEADLGITIGKDTLLVTYHPVTLERDALEWQINSLVSALKHFGGSKVITYPNTDDGSSLIIRKFNEYAAEDPSVCLVESLGIERYISIMNYCGAVVGNSSSIVIETPFMKIPAVNIGNRQAGRLMARNIICCGYTEDVIKTAIGRALSPEFVSVAAGCTSLYGEGDTSSRIVDVLEHIPLNDKLLKKKLEWEE